MPVSGDRGTAFGLIYLVCVDKRQHCNGRSGCQNSVGVVLFSMVAICGLLNL